MGSAQRAISSPFPHHNRLNTTQLVSRVSAWLHLHQSATYLDPSWHYKLHRGNYCDQSSLTKVLALKLDLTMGIPALLATFAACGSIVTSIKSGWELRRMVRRKVEAKECEEEAPYVFRRLRLAYSDGLMSVQEYELWYERFLVAKVEKDCKFSVHQAPSPN